MGFHGQPSTSLQSSIQCGFCPWTRDGWFHGRRKSGNQNPRRGGNIPRLETELTTTLRRFTLRWAFSLKTLQG